MTDAPKGPILIDLEAEAAAPNPADAPTVPDPVPVHSEGAAMATIAALGARRPSRLGQLLRGALVGFAGFALSLWAWDYVTGLLARNQILGAIALGLLVVLGLALLGLALRELAGLARMRRLDGVHRAAEAAVSSGDRTAAQGVVKSLDALYSGRAEMAQGRADLNIRGNEQVDADALLGLAEICLMHPLDKAASREVEAAARQVATVTAVVPLAFADLAAALFANLRMIRRIAEIYGGRSGSLGNWRLTRTVLAHLVATGAVAVGDDLIQSVAGGGLVSRLSRRFGEGIVNGALTARVGVAAIEVCRPLPFLQADRPSVTALVKRALTGLFGKSEDDTKGSG